MYPAYFLLDGGSAEQQFNSESDEEAVQFQVAQKIYIEDSEGEKKASYKRSRPAHFDEADKSDKPNRES